MLSLNDKISLRQLQILLVLDIFGTGVIILPRKVAEYANQDGWIVVILTTLVAMLAMYIITSLGSLFPNDSFLTYCSKIVTKPVAVVLSLGFIFKILVGVAMQIRFFGEIVKQTMLYNTPFFAIFLGIILVSAYAAAKGYETRARIAEILIFVIFVPLTFVFIVASMDVDFTNLMPVLRTHPYNFTIGIFFSGIAFTGIEFALLIYPYMQKPKSVRKSAVLAILFTGICMTLITVITIGKFGPIDIKRQMWPVVEMMDVIDFPGSFIERQDALIMSFWIVSVFSVVNAGLFFSSVLMKDLVKKGKHSYYILISIPIVCVLAYLPRNIGDVYTIMQFMYLSFGLIYMIILPVLLLIIATIRGLGGKKS